MGLYRRFWLFFLTVYLLDLLTKSWIVGRAEGLTTNPIVIIDAIAGAPAFLKITYVTNPGAAWSMLSDYPVFLTVLAAVALILIFVLPLLFFVFEKVIFLVEPFLVFLI